MMKKNLLLKKMCSIFLFTLFFTPVIIGQTVYTWNPAGDGVFSTAANWNPNRAVPDISDILVFDDGGSYIVTGLATQTIGQLSISDNTNVTLQATAVTIFTIAGGLGSDLNILAGSSLTLSGSTAISLTIATGATGSVSGSISCAGGVHKILPADASALTFNSGATLTQVAGCTGNIFNNSGTANAVIFTNGSIFIQQAGSNPFGLSQPASRVVFQTGSLFKLEQNASPALSGRTYADLEINFAGFSQAALTGGNPFVVDNLTITSVTTANFNLTGNVTINGNLTVAAGNVGFNPVTSTGSTSIKGDIDVTGGSLGFGPSVPRTTYFDGNSTQNITGVVTFITPAAIICSQNLVIAGTVTCPLLETSNQLTVLSEGTLTVNNTATLKSGASFINLGIATFTTSIAELYLPNAAQWYYFSIPVNTSTANVICDVAVDELYEYSTSTSAWTQITVGTTGLVPSKGYAVRLAAPKLISYTGILNTGTLNQNLSAIGNNWFLIGNSYPSSIDWGSSASPVAGWTMTDVRATTYVRTNGTFDVYNYEGGTFVNNGSQYIPPMQAYWVKVTGGAPLLTTTDLVRVQSSEVFVKSEMQNPQLRLKVSRENFSDEALIVFNEKAQNDYEKFDAEKYFTDDANYPQLYSYAGTIKSAINGLPVLEEGTKVQLGLKTLTAGNFTIKASEIETLNGYFVYLVDKDLQKVISLNQTPEYTFYSNISSGSDRFSVYFVTGLNHFEIDFTKDATDVDVIGQNNIAVYSNASDLFVRTNSTDGNITVYNLLGKVIISTPITQNLSKFFIEQSGGYIVKIISGKHNVSRKIYIP